MKNYFEQQRSGQNQGSGRGSNLSQEDRSQGGRNSASSQKRDDQGQFAGKKEPNVNNMNEDKDEMNR